MWWIYCFFNHEFWNDLVIKLVLKQYSIPLRYTRLLTKLARIPQKAPTSNYDNGSTSAGWET